MTKTTATAAATAFQVTTRYSSHPVTGAGRITVKGPNGQRTFPYDHGARDAHDTAVSRYIDAVMPTPDYRAELLETDGGRRRYELVAIDYSQDDDERHPDEQPMPTYVRWEGPTNFQRLVPDNR